MIHICKTKKGNFIVANIAKNGEILKVSETLNSKQAAWKNIKAELKNCYHYTFGYVQDDTLEKPVVYLQGLKRVVANGINPEKKYTPKEKPTVSVIAKW